MVFAHDRARRVRRPAVLCAMLLVVLAAAPGISGADGATDPASTPRCADDPSFAVPFPDVVASSPFCSDIAWLLERGVTSGRPDGTYGPFETLTRGQMAAFLNRLAGSPAPGGDAPRFSDVPTTHPFAAPISWLAEQRITTGRPDGTFGPAEELTRGQMAAFLHRWAGEPAAPPAPVPFPDVAPGDTFAAAIDWLVSEQITSGRIDGSFGPRAELSRAQMATFLRRYDQVMYPDPLEEVEIVAWRAVEHDEAVFGRAGQLQMTRVAAGSRGVVAVGRFIEPGELGSTFPALWYSDDGWSWERLQTPPTPGAGFVSIEDVVAAADGYVAVGWASRFLDDTLFASRIPVVWRSVDGRVWEAVDDPSLRVAGEREMRAVSVGGPGFVAGGREGDAAAVWWSIDGRSWTQVTGQDTALRREGDWFDIAAIERAGSGLVAGGYSDETATGRPMVWTSPDGLSWTRQEAGAPSGPPIRRMVAGAPGLLAFNGGDSDLTGPGGATWAWTSTDGVTWRAASPQPTISSGSIRGVTTHGQGLLGVGHDQQGAAVWRSTDGLSWERDRDAEGFLEVPAGSRMEDVAEVGELIVAVGTQRDGPARVWVREPRTVFAMPDVVGVDLGVATTRVLATGVTDIVNRERNELGRQQCLVHDQDPAPGAPLLPGTVVTIFSYINLGECGLPVR